MVIQEWAEAEVIESLLVRADLVMAEGILIRLRRCDPNAAYHELLGAAKRHRVGLMAISSDLVHAAGIPNTALTAFEGRAYVPPIANAAISSTAPVGRPPLT